jgi:hypothetical protein
MLTANQLYKAPKVLYLRLKTSRDSYAATLKHYGRSMEKIGEMMGHSNSQVTENYMASLDMVLKTQKG